MDKAIAELEAEINSRYASFTRAVAKSLIETSPQWSGNLTANWNYSVGAPDESYSQIAAKGAVGADRLQKAFHSRFGGTTSGPYYAGHEAAVSHAVTRMNAVKPPTWRDPVYLTNATPDDEGGYLEETIESGGVKLRPVNLVAGQIALIEFTRVKAQHMPI